eukprot:931359_1
MAEDGVGCVFECGIPYLFIILFLWRLSHILTTVLSYQLLFSVCFCIFLILVSSYGDLCLFVHGIECILMTLCTNLRFLWHATFNIAPNQWLCRIVDGILYSFHLETPSENQW